MYLPIYIKEYHIYDVYHNDNNNLVIISPQEDKPLNISYNNDLFTTNICPDKHTYIYVLKREVKYKDIIKLTINDIVIETKVNKYPEFKDEIIMSTIVKNEDNYIRQWIIFHKNIGVTRFIIYNNSNTNTLEDVIKDFIDQNIVILVKWNYPYFARFSGISGQSTQQNHSIWAFQNSKYIGLFDVDEYVNIQNDTNIHNFFNNLIKDEKINCEKIGCFRLLNKFFYNPNNLPCNDFEFLKIYNCNKIKFSGNEKGFAIPKNVSVYCVHTITLGKPMYTVSHKKIYFNHYYFLNKLKRGKDKTDLTDSSIDKHTVNLL